MKNLINEYKLISDTLFSMNVIDAETKETAKSYSDRLSEIRHILNLSHNEIINS